MEQEMQTKFIRPIKRFVLLLDDQEFVKDGPVEYRKTVGCDHLDFHVVRVGTGESCDFGQGDKVLVRHPNVGRRLRLDGVVYRMVRVSDIIGVVE